MITCTKCKIEKNDDAYYKSRTTGKIVRPICRDCFREFNKASRKKRIERNRNGIDKEKKFNKKCTVCQKLKSNKDFTLLLSSPDGYDYTCKVCNSIKNKEFIIKIKSLKKKRVLAEHKCSRCKEVKSIDNFYESERFKSGYDNRCKDCRKYMATNISDDARKRKNEKTREKRRNKEYRKYRNERDKERRKNDFIYNLEVKIRNSFSSKLRRFNVIKTKDISKYGIKIKEIVEHLGQPPQDGKVYHIDHIFPVSAFNLLNETDIKICWNYRNLQWLEANENIVKQDKYNEEDFKKFYEEVKLLL